MSDKNQSRNSSERRKAWVDSDRARLILADEIHTTKEDKLPQFMKSLYFYTRRIV